MPFPGEPPSGSSTELRGRKGREPGPGWHWLRALADVARLRGDRSGLSQLGIGVQLVAVGPESSRLVRCGLAVCRRLFAICSRCDRGQRYCSAGCRFEGRRRSLREAGRRHQSSPEGRLDHADRQRRYRARVTHQGLEKLRSEPKTSPPAREPARRSAHAFPVSTKACVRCGRPARFLRELPLARLHGQPGFAVLRIRSRRPP